jgi:hypothetical protein
VRRGLRHIASSVRIEPSVRDEARFQLL